MASEQTGDFNTSRSSNVAKVIQDIYALVDHLESLFPGRHFTPDGHMVGSIGEVLAEEHYDLELYEASEPLHDAISKCGREVQIKATQSSRIALRGDRAPEHLIVLSLNADGRTAEVFNGPGQLAWENAGAVQRNGQRPISLSRLRSLMSQIPKEQRLVNSDQVIMDVTSENKSPSLTDIENIISNISDRCEGLVTNGQRDEIINERVLHHMFSWEVGQWFTRHGCGLWDDIILQPEHPTSLKYLKDKINLNDAQETIQHSIGQGTSGNFDFVLNGAPPVCLEWKGPKLFSEKGAVEVLLKLLSEPSESLKIFAGIFTSSTTGKYNHIETAHNRLKNALDFVERVLGIHVNQSSNLYCYLVTIPDSGSRRIHWGNITG